MVWLWLRRRGLWVSTLFIIFFEISKKKKYLHDSVVAGAFLLPITIEALAAHNSVEISDYQTPCNYTEPGYKCAVKLGNSWIDPSAFYFYTNSVGVAIQALILIGMGSLADHGSGRKSMMLFFGMLGALTTGCFMFVHNPGRFF